MIFFGLLYLSNAKSAMVNNAFGPLKKQMLTYLKNAQVLKLSLAKKGIAFELVTNNKAEIDAILSEENFSINSIELDFKLNFPEGISFHGAHFKIEVFKYLSEKNIPYAGIIDLDMVCLNPLPLWYKDAIANKYPVYYDISDQMFPAFGQEKILKDLQILDNKISIGNWIGGEFLSGPPDFFAALYTEIEKILPAYSSNIALMSHQGDETLTSVAIENLKKAKSFLLIEGGALGLLARYWSVVTKHTQRDISAFKDVFLLHLPTDKLFLATLSEQDFNDGKFFAKYQNHLFMKSLLYKVPFSKQIFKLIKKIKAS